MAIITISRQTGSYGDQIAECIADNMNYSLIEKNKLYEMAATFKGDYSKEIEVLSNESKPGFFDFLFHQRSIYGHLFSAMIYECASQDNVVVMGRGGQFLFKESDHVINARIVAPLDIRIRRIQEEFDTEKDMAAEIIRKSDQGREEFIRYLFREEVADPRWYDIVIDTSRFTKDTIVDFLNGELRRIEKQNPMTDSDRHFYKEKSLEKRIEIVLMKEMKESNYIKVKANYNGDVIISGYLATEAENRSAESIVKEVSGVVSVENRIVVSQFPVRPWY